MTSSAKKVLAEALALTDAERREVAEALLDSVAPTSVGELEAAWNGEARARADRLARGEIEARDGNEVLEEIRAELRARRRQ